MIMDVVITYLVISGNPGMQKTRLFDNSDTALPCEFIQLQASRNEKNISLFKIGNEIILFNEKHVPRYRRRESFTPMNCVRVYEDVADQEIEYFKVGNSTPTLKAGNWDMSGPWHWEIK